MIALPGSEADRPGIERVPRLAAIDVLRGIVMILMALDHVRDFFGHVALNPTDPATTSAPLFFTRWITHLCAPTFFLLTGLGAGLSRAHRSTEQLSRHLITRGFWLLCLEWVVVRCFGFQFNVDYHVTVLTVLWALGWAMIVLAGLVRFSPRTVASIGAVMILVHNLFDPIPAGVLGLLAPVWTWLHAPGLLVATPVFTVAIAYPLIPWVGVTMVGYGLSMVYQWDAERRRRLLWRASGTLLLAFVSLRGVNIYGDPSRWSVQASVDRTLFSILNTTKYPPSLLFLLMTLGPALGLLAALDGRRPRLTRPAWVFGQVPLFYFLLHLPVIHLLAVLLCYARLGAVHWMFESPDLSHFPFSQPPGWGFDLPVVYGIWVVVVAGMYPLCRWYAGAKGEHPRSWMSYL